MKRGSIRLHLEQLEDRTLLSGPGDIDWLRQVGSVVPAESRGYAAAVDGDLYAAGYVAGALPGQTSAGGEDGYVRKYDAAGNVLWTRQFGSTTSGPLGLNDRVLGVAGDSSGVYVVGQTNGTLPGQAFAGGTSDAFVRKYDPAGNELWTRQFGSAVEFDVANDVAVDASGVYVVGQIAGAGGQAFVRKYDLSGNLLWNSQFGSSGGDAANGIVADASGVYVSGSFGASDSGLVGQGPFVRKYDTNGNPLWIFHTNAAAAIAVDGSAFYVAGTVGGLGSDVVVAKYNFTGILVWSRQFGATVPAGRVITDRGWDITVDASGVYVAGESDGFLAGFGGTGAFVRKYDTGGNELWTRHFGVWNPLTTGGGSTARGIGVDPSGVYVIGDTSNPFPGQTSTGSVDMFVRKYDGGGNELWTRESSSAAPTTDVGRAVDADGNVYLVGRLGATGPFVRKYDAAGSELWTRNLGSADAQAIAVDASGVYVAGSTFAPLPGQTSAGGQDAFVRKYDATGNELWTRQFGTDSTDSAGSITVDASGVYVAGFVDHALPGQTSAGGTDAFVRKYDAAGSLVWTRQFGTSLTDQATGVAVGGSSVYVAGKTDGALPGQTNAGFQDAFVRAYDTTGNLLWTRQFGTATTDATTGIAADASGAYVTGLTAGSFPGQTSAGIFDAFVRKYDTGGAEVWTRQFGTAGSDQANGVAIGATGVYVAGFVGGVLPGQTGAGGQDAFVFKYDTDGAAIWTRQLGTAGTDSAAGVTVGTSGLYVAGFTTGTFPGQIGGDLDAFVAKLVDTVSNTPPSNLSVTTNLSINENSVATLAGAFTDSDAADTHTVVINWGPGEGVTTLNLAVGVTTFSASHTYLDDNPTGTTSNIYSINVIVSDASASTSGSASLTINNVAPVATIISPASGSVFTVGMPIVFSGAFSDASTGDTHTAQWTFGAVTVAGSVTQGSGSGTVSDSYTFGAPGVYTVRLTVTDDDGGVSSELMTVRLFAATATVAAVSTLAPLFGVDGVTVSAVVSVVAPGSGNPTGTVTFYDGAGVLGTANLIDGAASLALGNTALAPGLHTIRAVYTGDGNFLGSDSPAGVVNVLAPSTIQGLVYVDFNNDGQLDFGERAIAGVTVALTGTDDLGHGVSRMVQTDANGIYAFLNLRPSNTAGYTLTETQPSGLLDGRDTLGTVNDVPTGSAALDDAFGGVVISQGGSSAENYNFGERPATKGGVGPGQTATIGFWQNPNGQNLVRSLNGGASATQLGHWLAATFPNMYGSLDGKTNAEIAEFYKTLFARTVQRAAGGGPPKMDAQVMAVALATYVTNQTLAGNTASAFGFQVSQNGLGTRTFNVSGNGAAFGVANNSSVTVLDLLLAVNSRSRNGLLYDIDGDGDAADGQETLFRTMANDVFSAINQAGDI